MSTIDLSQYDVPGRGHGILDVFRWRYLLRVLVRKGTATRYRNSVFGWGWSYVKPAIQYLVYFLIMGILLGFGGRTVNYPVYLFAGIIALNLFNEAFGNATTAITDNRALVRKIYLPRELFPIAAIIVAFIHFLPQVAILLIVLLLFGWTPSFAGIGAVLLGIVLITVLSLGLGLFFAGINVRYRDAQNFVEIIRMVSTWASPVLYIWPLVAEKAPSIVRHIYFSNPVTVAVELFHWGWWQPTLEVAARRHPDLAQQVADTDALPPHFGYYVAFAIIACVIVLAIGQAVFRHFERTFAQDL
ncbi:MAG: ABC transporter permease [Microbacterium sp.]